ncbi:MAG: HEAT repeat domain-containing protein [Acidobacteriaceae bacterium]
MKPYSYFDRIEPNVQRFEQTVSTVPLHLQDALERITPKTETSATSNSPTARTYARQLVFAVALSALSVSAQPIVLPSLGRREIVTSAESSPASVDLALVEQMRQIFVRGASEFFEDGMDSNFAQELLLCVKEYGNAAIDAISEYLFSSAANSDVASEALRRLAEVEDRRIFAPRWALLQRGLRHRSSRVRDGAILGFASLDDRRALDLLKSVETEEPVAELRHLIQKVIKQLGTIHGKAAAQG